MKLRKVVKEGGHKLIFIVKLAAFGLQIDCTEWLLARSTFGYPSTSPSLARRAPISQNLKTIVVALLVTKVKAAC